MTVIKKWLVKMWEGYRSIALEVAALLFMTSVLMTYLIMQDFVIERVCRVNLGYPDDVCQAVIQNKGNYTTEETNIQKVMTQVRRTRAVLDYSIPILFVIFQGSWSDIHGRKLPLLLPCVGFILQAVALAASYFFQHWDAFAVVLVSTIPKCLSGSDVTFRMAALSYVSDISTRSGRTLRTGLISAAFTLGVPIGFAVGGTAVKAAVQPEFAFLVSAGICTTAFLTIAFFVDNKPTVSEVDNLQLPPNIKADDAKKESLKTCMSMENIKSILKSLVLSFDGVSTTTRIQIVLLVFAVICINAPIQGEFGVMYLYLRKKLSWDSGDYGLFSTYVSLIGVIGTVISMGVFCSLLKLSDPVIGFIAGVSQFGGSFMYAFAYTDLMIYLAPAIDMLNGTMAVVAKSMLSKLCPSDDYGKLFSFLAVIELLVPLFFDPTYSTIYEHTIESFPGCVFLLSAALTIPPQLIYIFYIWTDRNTVTCEITERVSESECIQPESCKRGRSKQLQSAAGENCGTDIQPNEVVLKSASSTATVDTMIP